MRNLIGKLKGLLKKGLYFGGGLITGAMCYNLAFIVGNENHLFGEICQKLGITGHTLAIIGLWLFVFALLIQVLLQLHSLYCFLIVILIRVNS